MAQRPGGRHRADPHRADRPGSDPHRAGLAPADGEADLLKAFRAICIEQFAVDLRDGAAHLAARDAPALRRVAHNLISVLATLREPAAAECARRLEDAVLSLEWAASQAAWHDLQAGLLDVMSRPHR